MPQIRHGKGLCGLALVMTGCGILSPHAEPTFTPYPFVTASPAPAATAPLATATVPPVPTASIPPPQPTLRGSPVVSTIGPQDTLTPLPSPTIPGVESNCSVPPKGGFRTIYETDPGVPPAIGCPLSSNPDEPPQEWIVETRWQPFEHGEMLQSSQLGWDLSQPVVYVLYDDGTYQRFDDVYRPGVDPLVGELPPPAGYYEPEGHLGKIWRDAFGINTRLGWATGPEVQERTFMQVFTSGEMIFVVPTGKTYAFFHGSPNTYLTYDVSFDQ